jgi:hypothetical protein
MAKPLAGLALRGPHTHTQSLCSTSSSSTSPLQVRLSQEGQLPQLDEALLDELLVLRLATPQHLHTCIRYPVAVCGGVSKRGGEIQQGLGVRARRSTWCRTLARSTRR